MGIKPQLLRRCSPFAELSASQLAELAELADMRWVDRGEYLYRQGDVAQTVYAVLDGAIKLSRVTDGGRVMVTDFLGPGDLAGERAVLGEPEHLDDACALEDALVAAVLADALGTFLVRRPDATMGLARHLAASLTEREQKVAALSTKRVHQRLATGLLRLSGSLGVRSNGEVIINARITQAELADWIGTTRETASTLLNELRRAGYIDVVGRRIHLLDPGAVSAYAECEEPPDELTSLRTSSAESSAEKELVTSSA